METSLITHEGDGIVETSVAGSYVPFSKPFVNNRIGGLWQQGSLIPTPQIDWDILVVGRRRRRKFDHFALFNRGLIGLVGHQRILGGKPDRV